VLHRLKPHNVDHHQLLAELFRRGVKVWADGDRLHVRAPRGALTQELRDALAAQKPEILSSVSAASIGTQAFHVPISGVSRNGHLPLSFNQQRLWSLAQLDPVSPVYNLAKAIRLSGAMSVAALEQSLRQIVQRHEILRSTFRMRQGVVEHCIAPQLPLQLPLVDLREYPPAERQAQIERWCSAEAREPFDLTRAPLWRVKLLRLEENEHLLILTVHHLVFDGRSFAIFCRELAQIHAGLADARAAKLPALPIQYIDFAHWEQQKSREAALNAQLGYWMRQLDGVAALELPLDRARAHGRTSPGARQPLVLPAKLVAALKALGQREECTLYMTLLAAFQTLLHAYSSQKDVVVCSSLPGRQWPETQPLIGLFSSLVPMRTDLSGNPSFRDLLARVRRVVLDAYQHQDVPLQRVAAAPGLLQTPLARGMFLMQLPNRIPDPPGLFRNVVDIHNGMADFDLSLSMEETSPTIAGVLEYKSDLFDAATIVHMTRSFRKLLEEVVSDPAQRIAGLRLPPRPARNRSGRASPVSAPARPAFVAPRDKLESELADIWRNVFRRKRIGVKDDFFQLGGHSLLAVRLFAQVENLCGGRIPLAALLQATTIEQLADLLRQHNWTRHWSSLVAIKPGGAKPPFYCVHGSGGNVLRFRALAEHLDPEQPFYGLQAKGLDGQETPFTRVEEMAAHYLGAIRALQPEGPYRIGGFSGGGLIAFEMARQLHAQGQRVPLLALIDTHVEQQANRNELPDPVRRITRHMRKIVAWPFEKKLAYVRHRLPPQHMIDPHSRVIAATALAGRTYVPQRHPGPVTLFCATDAKRDASLEWRPFAAGTRVFRTPGGHVSILDEPQVRVLARRLQACLDEAMNDDVPQHHHRKPGDLPTA
jgi:thioesterase domain-containing protein/acyl carrier protein